MSIRDELLKWANGEQARGNDVSIQEIAQHAQKLVDDRECYTAMLLGRIREAAGDARGALMQDELVGHIADLRNKAADHDELAAYAEYMTRQAHTQTGGRL